MQYDYGSFKPRFIGVQINIHDELTHYLYFRHQYATKDYLQSIKGENNIFNAISYATVYDHEFKHLIDSLISPISNDLFRIQLTRAVNAKILYRHLPQSQIIGLPIQDWVLNKKNCHKLIEEEINYSKKLKKYKYSSVFREDHKKIAKIISDTDNSLKVLNINPYSKIQPFHVYEASAILYQQCKIILKFGIEKGRIFIAKLLETNKKYVLILEMLSQINFKYPVPAYSLIIRWCLMGSQELDGENACPSNRFIKIFAYLYKSPFINFNKSVLETFNEWNEILGFSTIQKSLNHIVKANKRNIDKLLSSVQKEYEDSFEELPTAIKKIELSERLINDFLENPNDFVFQRNFHEKFKNIKAPILLNYPNRMCTLKEDFEKDFTPMLFDVPEDESEIIIHRAIQKQNDHKNYNYIFSERDAINLADFMESAEYMVDSNRSKHFFDFYHEILKRSKLTSIELDVLTAFN